MTRSPVNAGGPEAWSSVLRRVKIITQGIAKTTDKVSTITVKDCASDYLGRLQ